MIRKYCSLNIYFKIVVWSVVLMILTTLVSLYFFINNNFEVPLGIVVGLGLGALLYLMTGIIEFKNKDSIWLMAANIIRLFVLGGSLIGLGFLYYYANVHVINIFAVVGGYTAVIIIFVILFLLDKKEIKNS